MPRQKSYPFRLLIGHRSVLVAPMSHKESEKQQADGIWVSTLGLIGVKHPDEPAEQARILLHELIHAILDVWGHSDQLAKNEETICGWLDRGLAKVYQDNPHLLAILALALSANQSPFSAPTLTHQPLPKAA